MRLEELEAHIPDQTLKINELINFPTHFADFVEKKQYPSWATFRNSVWGNASASAPSDASEKQAGLEVQEEICTEIDVSATGDGEPSGDAPSTHPFVKLPETLPRLWGFDSSHILVRPEYEEAEQAALAGVASNDDTFLVIGQSGIGKSVFLVWLLIRRLALKLPTALQIRGHQALLFHEGGVSLFQDLRDDGAYLELGFSDNPSSRIWVLVDSSLTLPEPAPIFCMGYPFFVVQAASREHHLEWCKKVLSQYFYMKTWALSEVLQVRPLLGLSRGGPHGESNIRYLYNEYRASPRALAMYASNPQAFTNRVVAQVLRMTPDGLRHALKNPESDDSSHLIIRIEPSAERSLSTKTIASPGAFKLLWDQHLKNRVTDMEYYYDIFQQGGPITATAAGWIFEFRMHQLLAQDYLLNLFPLRNPNGGRVFDVYSDYSDSRKKRNEMKFQLTTSSVCPLDEGIELEVGRYYRPEAKNFPTIDALLLIKPQPPNSLPILLMFQITRNQSGHDVKKAGLDMVATLELPVNTQTYYVAITPHNIEPPIQVPKGYFKDVHVFHHPIPQNILFPHK